MTNPPTYDCMSESWIEPIPGIFDYLMSHDLRPVKLTNPLTGNTRLQGPTDTEALAKMMEKRR